MKAGIIGFGEIGRQLLSMLQTSAKTPEVAFFDDHAHAKGMPNAFPFSAHTEDRFSNLNFYLGLGYLHLARKLEILDWMLQAGRNVPPLVHPQAVVDPSAKLGPGVAVFPGCVVGLAAEIGGGTLFGPGSVVAHDTQIGRGCYVAVAVIVCGRVKIGDRVFLGSGAVVGNHRTVGTDARVGMATAVTHDVPVGASVLGNPMRLLPQPLKLGGV
jgi:sugar O-acyltransferase (sialic acid O-acetyltransferase NeuD family)